MKKWQPLVAAGLLAVILGVGTCTYRKATRPPTSTELRAKAVQDREHTQFLAKGTAGAIVKERMKNPQSFDLSDIAVNRGMTDDHQPCWIVAVTYRGTNSFGAVVTSHALVWVTENGEAPLRVVDVADSPAP